MGCNLAKKWVSTGLFFFWLGEEKQSIDVPREVGKRRWGACASVCVYAHVHDMLAVL